MEEPTECHANGTRETNNGMIVSTSRRINVAADRNIEMNTTNDVLIKPKQKHLPVPCARHERASTRGLRERSVRAVSMGILRVLQANTHPTIFFF